MKIRIRKATRRDVPQILTLFPRLANFDVPAKRLPAHLWEGDATLLEAWGRGEAPQCLVHIAVEEDNTILGATLVTLGEEFLSHEPSAHLEVLVVADGAEGKGIGRALLENAESVARRQGALSMTLHVFGANKPARVLYHHQGYDEELIRAIKHFV